MWTALDWTVLFAWTVLSSDSSNVPLDAGTSPIGLGHLSFDPCFDFAPSVANVSADSEAWRPFSSVSPLVDRCDGDCEVFGEFLDGE